MKAAVKPAPESPEKLRLRLWLRMLKSSRRIEDRLRRRLRDEFDSTLPRFDVLSALARFPDGLKMTEVSDLLRVSNGNITGIVDRLTQEGLVLRIAVPGDRRAQRVRLTPKGAASFAAQAAEHEAWIAQMLGGLSDGDAQAMLGMLDDLLAGVPEKG